MSPYRFRHRILCIAAFLTCCLTLAPAQPDVKRDITDVAIDDSSSFFYIDTSAYPGKNHQLPIGVFDSGTGGLTVLDAIVSFDGYDNITHRKVEGGDGVTDFRQECFIYLGDKANMPYGSYAKEGNTELLKEHIVKDAQFLLSNKYYNSAADKDFRTDKPGVKAIVIACNTATAYGKTEIQQLVDRSGLDVKVIGVIDAGARSALNTIGKDQDASIAVLATAGTVSSNGYVNALRAEIAKSGYSGNIMVFQQAGIGMAAAIDGEAEYIRPDATEPDKRYKGPSDSNPDARIYTSLLPRYGFERGDNELLFSRTDGGESVIQLNSVRNYISYNLVTLMEKIRNTPNAGKLTAVILGCTHYPFYTDLFREKLDWLYQYKEDGRYIYRDFMARRIDLIDPAPSVADELYTYLKGTDRFSNDTPCTSRFFLSVPNTHNANVQLDSDGTFTYDYKYHRPAGFIQQYVKRVPFSEKCIDPDVYRRVSEKMPLVYEMIRNAENRN